MTDFDGHAVPGAERNPASLVILQAVTRALYFDHPVALLLRPELDQIRHAGPVGADVAQQPVKPSVQMLGGQAVQGQIEYLQAEAPIYEGRLNAKFAGVVRPDYLFVAVCLQVPSRTEAARRLAPGLPWLIRLPSLACSEMRSDSGNAGQALHS